MASIMIKRIVILLILPWVARGRPDYGSLIRTEEEGHRKPERDFYTGQPIEEESEEAKEEEAPVSKEPEEEGSGFGDTLKTSALYGVGVTAATLLASAGVEYADTLYNEYSDKTKVLKKMWSCKTKLQTPDREQCQNQAVKNYCSTAVCESAVWDAWFTSTYSNKEGGGLDTDTKEAKGETSEWSKLVAGAEKSTEQQETNDEVADEISEGEKSSECASMCKKSKKHCTACQMMMDSCSSECPKKCAACAQICLPFAKDFSKAACNTCNTNTHCGSCQRCINNEYKRLGKSPGF